MSMAVSLKNIRRHPVVEAALDRSRNVTKPVEKLLQLWPTNLFQRSDLDMFTVLHTLVQRQAVVELEHYKALRAVTHTDDRTVTHPGNRMGELLSIVPNNQTHAFCIRVNDHNVVRGTPDTGERVGDPTHFAVTNDSGDWHSGAVNLIPRWNTRETEFLDSLGYVPENCVPFSKFVHANLYQSMYSARSLAARIAERRLTDELHHWDKVVERLIDNGVRLPERRVKKRPKFKFPKFADGSTSVIVDIVETDLLMPELVGQYRNKVQREDGSIHTITTGQASDKSGNLRYAIRQRDILVRQRESLRAAIKAIDLAFKTGGFKGTREYGNETHVHWEVPPWERNYFPEHKPRTRFSALHVDDEISLLYRLREKTVRVNPRYAERQYDLFRKPRMAS